MSNQRPPLDAAIAVCSDVGRYWRGASEAGRSARQGNAGMKIIPILLCALLGLVGCGKTAFDGPGTKADIEHLHKVWGVDLPGSDATLVKKAPDLMVYIVAHDRLQPYEQSLRKDWQPLSAGTIIRHAQFVVDGSTDTKARYAKWKGDNGRIRYIVLDYSTGFVSYFSLTE